MPEGIEVCLTSLYLDEVLKGKILEEINTIGGRYSRHVLKGLDEFKDPHEILNVDSKGKFMYFHLRNIKNGKDAYILNRFGLEGEWGKIKQKHSGVELKIRDGDSFYFSDSRNFGTLEIVYKKSVLDEELGKLAPDFLKTNLSKEDFCRQVNLLSKKKGDKEIIKILMEQNVGKGLGSGLGNYLGVEILYHAKISPHTKLKDIDADQEKCQRLDNSVKYILRLSYMKNKLGYFEHFNKEMTDFIKVLRESFETNPADVRNYHKDIKIKKNDVFRFNVYRQNEDPHGNEVIGDKIISGRTTYWVPSVQK